jgi:hypothetical protein
MLLDPLDPRPELIRAHDIAVALSRQARFNGHTVEFYSVAQHSVIVSQYTRCPLSGLLHDAAEAYIGDMVRPMKAIMPDFGCVERRLQLAIEQRFDLLPGSLSTSDVAHWDDALLATELSQMMPGCAARGTLPPALADRRLVALPPAKALSLFNERFKDLLGVWPVVFDSGLEHGELRSYAGILPGERL